MTRMLLAAISGHGKSWHAQAIMEQNVQESDYEGLIVLDFKDEYRGLAKAGYCSHAIVGPAEAEASVADWRAQLRGEPYIVLARLETMGPEAWRDACATIATAARRLDRDVLVAVDEAHFVAPNRGKIPDALEGLATTGRGEGASSLWISQRIAKLDTTVTAQCDAAILGGFRDKNDLSRIEGTIEYPREAHVPGGRSVPGLPEAIHAPDEGAISVRKWEEDGSPIGSEWIYSDESGDMRRIDTRQVNMDATHYGPPGNTIALP